jgi:hypothetical protein
MLSRIWVLLAVCAALSQGASSAQGKATSSRLAIRKLSPKELGVASASAGEARTIIATQSFAVHLPSGEERWFVPALEAKAGTLTYVQLEGDPSALEPIFDELSWPAETVEAVTFNDVDSDGTPDAIVLLKFGADPVVGTRSFRAARVFTRGRAGLEISWAMTDRANFGRELRKAAEAQRRLKDQKLSVPVLPSPPPHADFEGRLSLYRMHSNVGDKNVRCHGKAKLSGPEGQALCFRWTLLSVHCVGFLEADPLHANEERRWQKTPEGDGTGGAACVEPQKCSDPE